MLEQGGTAFPVEAPNGDVHSGMTLRDYFAGQALAGLSANPQFDVSVEVMSEWAWEQADAMLAAREESNA